MIVGYSRPLLWLAFTMMLSLYGKSQHSQLWLTYQLQGKLNKQWSYLTDINHRRANGFVEKAALNAVRFGAGYNIQPAHQVAAGVAWLQTFANYKALLYEYRLWQQWLHSRTGDKMQWQHRIRLEERWLQVGDIYGVNHSSRIYQTRLRYQLQLRFPLFQTEHNSLQTSSEIMLQAGKNFKQPLNQLRLLGGWHSTISHSFSVLLAYQFILAGGKSELIQDRIHSIRITAMHQITKPILKQGN